MYGLQLVSDMKPYSEEVIDVIAVCGIDGGQETAHTSPSYFRLAVLEFFRKCSKQMRVWIYTYPLISENSGIFSREGMNREATRLLEGIQSLEYQKIVLLGQDIGGILVKEALIQAAFGAFAFRNIYHSTRILVFIGCPHIYGYSPDLDESLCRLLDLSNDLKAMPRKVITACLGDAIEAINTDFVDVDLQLSAAVYNVYSITEDLQKRIFLRHESETPNRSTPIRSNVECSLSHVDMAGSMLLNLCNDIEIYAQGSPKAELSKLRSYASSLFYASSHGLGDHHFSGELQVLEKSKIEHWSSIRLTPFLTINNIHNIHSVGNQILRFLFPQFDTSSSDISLFHQFHFRPWDCRSNTVEAMLSTFLKQAVCNITEGTLSACPWSLRGQSLGWNIEDLFNIYYHAILTRADITVVWVLIDLDERIESRSWLLNKLRTTITRCDLHFTVIFLNGNVPEVNIGPEYTTTVDWNDSKAEIEREGMLVHNDNVPGTSSNANQRLLVSRSTEIRHHESQDQDKIRSSALDTAESEALHVIRRNAGLMHIDSLGPKLVNFFQQPEFSFEHKTMVAIWLSNLETNDSTISRSRLHNTLGASLEITFQTILEFAIPGFWGLSSAIETLQLLVLAFRPLTYRELSDLERARVHWEARYTPRPTGAKAILSWLPGIIDICTNELHFSHPDFREYLCSANIEHLEISEKELPRTHSRLAHLCLEYLVSSHGQKLLQSVQINAEDIAAPNPRRDFLSYAAEHWPEHARIASTEFPLRDDAFLRLISDKTLLDTWAKVYWVRTSSATCPGFVLSTPLACFAKHGLEIIVKTLLEVHKGTKWLEVQLLDAIIIAARNGMIDIACLLLDLQSLDSEQLNILVQASLQSGNQEMISFFICKALEIPNSSICSYVTLPQALAKNQRDISLKILSHLTWDYISKEGKKKILLAACTGGDIEIVNRVLDCFEVEMDKDDIFEAALQACRNAHAALSSSLLIKTLKIEDAEAGAKTDRAHSPHMANDTLKSGIGELPGDKKLEDTDEENLSSPREYQQSTDSTPLQTASDQAIADSGLEKSINEALSGYQEVILQTAVSCGHFDVIQSLLKTLGKCTTSLSFGHDLLRKAISLQRPRCFKILLEALHRADVASQSSATLDRNDLLIRAIQVDNISMVESLLSNGIVLDDTTFPIILHDNIIATSKGFKAVDLLIKEGRKKHITGTVMKDAMTQLLEIGVEKNCEKLVRTCLRAGIDVNQKICRSIVTPLYFAAYMGYVEIVKALIEAGADTEIPGSDCDGWFPMHVASQNPEVLELLLAAGANVNIRSNHEYTPLYLAISGGHQDSVAKILEYLPDLNCVINQRTILRRALTSGREDIAIMLLDAGTDPCHPSTKHANALLLHLCVFTNSVNFLRKLLLHNFDIECEDEVGCTPMNSLEDATNIPVLRLLIQRGAKVNTSDNYGKTPLSVAVSSNDFELAEFLVSHGANVNQYIRSEGTPLLLACKVGTMKMVKMLIENGENAKIVHQGIQDTMFQAVCQNETDAKPDLLSYLLENEMVNVREESALWGSDLHTASLMTDIDIIDLLIRRGAYVNARDMIGRRPIHFALYRTLNHVKCLRDRENGAELFVKDEMQRNALHFAVVSGRLDVVKYVLDERPGLAKEKDYNGCTPLFWAVRKCSLWDTQTSERKEIIELLKDNGADIMDVVHDVYGSWTPLSLARYYDLGEEIVALVTPSKKQIAKGHYAYTIFWRQTISKSSQVAQRREGVFCSVCLLGVFGTYYKCRECAKFVLCFMCYRARGVVHRRHEFISMYGKEQADMEDGDEEDFSDDDDNDDDGDDSDDSDDGDDGDDGDDDDDGDSL